MGEHDLYECSMGPQHQRSACRTAGAWALGAVPRGQATSDVSRIEAALPQHRGYVAANFEAVGAVHEHRGLGGELATPVIDAFRIAPDGTRHGIGVPRHAVSRPGV